MSKKLNVAIVGLGFGAEFIPIYQNHPIRNVYAICQRTKSKLDEIGDAFGIEKRYTSFEELLNDPNVDAVHINTPDPRPRLDEHRCAQGRQARRLHRPDGPDAGGMLADRRGPEGFRQEVHDDGDGGLHARVPVRQGARDSGKLGRLQFLRAAHHQEMAAGTGRATGQGMPPMHYATHCVGPCLALTEQAGRLRVLLWLGPDQRRPGRQVRLALRRRNHSRQAEGFGSVRRNHRARCTTPRASTSRASMLMAARRPSSGSRSNRKSRSCSSARKPSG